DLWCIASAGSRQAAVDGAFVDAFLAAVNDRKPTSSIQPYIAPEALVSSINERLAVEGYQQESACLMVFDGSGIPPFFPDPRYVSPYRGIDVEMRHRERRQDLPRY